MQTSAQGISALEAEEGVVLRAYRDSAGVLTIGAGLTAASGVVKPKIGMVITKAEATNLLQKALRQSYEPAVARAMGATKQYEFDAGVSFHWNTGAIARASWVKRWKAKAGDAAITVGLLAWNKGGGKVLPGLEARRKREAAMLLSGVYYRAEAPAKVTTFAAWGVRLSGAEIATVRAGFAKLGYNPGQSPNAILAEAARKFQRDHDLTVDGIIGRATLSTLQRRLDVRTKAATAAMVSAPAGASSGAVDQTVGLPHVEAMIWVGIALWAAWIAWRYRDVIAAKIQPRLPRVANLLRSI